MSDINLGTLVVCDGTARRDAIHFAIAPVCSDEILLPGQHVGLIGNSHTKVGQSDKPIGIVDPFLTKPIPAGSWFWMMLYQKTVTGMRHEWEHPAFVETEVKGKDIPLVAIGKKTGVSRVEQMRKESEIWLVEFCNNSDCPGFNKVMEKAIEIADGGSGSDFDYDYMHFDGMDAHGSIPPEFWTHVEIYLGRPIKGKKATHFSCSC